MIEFKQIRTFLLLRTNPDVLLPRKLKFITVNSEKIMYACNSLNRLVSPDQEVLETFVRCNDSLYI